MVADRAFRQEEDDQAALSFVIKLKGEFKGNPAMSSTLRTVALYVFALLFVVAIACESPTTITNDNDNDNSINSPPVECGVTTELINGECVAKTCDEGFELDDEGECVESIDED